LRSVATLRTNSQVVRSFAQTLYPIFAHPKVIFRLCYKSLIPALHSPYNNYNYLY
jgi:hypothetical protein